MFFLYIKAPKIIKNMSSYVYLTFDFFCKFHSLRVCQGFLLFFYAFEIQDLAHKLNYRLGFVERSGRN